MAAHRRLTDEQLRTLRAILESIRRARALLAQMPTHAELARTLGVSRRLIDEISRGRVYKT